MGEKDSQYTEWKSRVNVRDNYKCRECGVKGNQAHHIKSWKDHPKLRFDINNGITLCLNCHKKHGHGGRPKVKDGKIVAFYLRYTTIEKLKEYSHKIKTSMSQAVEDLIENAKA